MLKDVGSKGKRKVPWLWHWFLFKNCNTIAYWKFEFKAEYILRGIEQGLFEAVSKWTVVSWRGGIEAKKENENLSKLRRWRWKFIEFARVFCRKIRFPTRVFELKSGIFFFVLSFERRKILCLTAPLEVAWRRPWYSVNVNTIVYEVFSKYYLL